MSMVISASSVMSRAYAGNIYFKDENYRKNSANHDVVSADHKAMVRALDRLERLDFESEDIDDTKTALHTVTSYLDIYNNTLSSAMDSDSSHIQRTAKNMKAMMKEHAKDLSAIGIQIKNDGTVKVDQNQLRKATGRQLSKVFGNDDYISGMKQQMKKLRNQVNRETPRQEGQTYVPETSGMGNDNQEGGGKSDIPASETVGSNLNLRV